MTEAPTIRGLRVLLVEDDVDGGELMQMALQHEGAVVVHVTRAADALERLEHEAFDVFVSDLGLPDVGGLELVGRVRETHPNLPALALTGAAGRQDVEETRRAGFDAYLAKPTQAEALVAALHRLAQGRAS